MQRHRMVIKRFDPWSVLKFSFLMNLAGLAMLLLAGRVVWFAVRRLMLIESVCDQASQILDLTDCGIDGGGLFQNAVVVGLFGVVVLTGFAVFFTFLLNLISDLTGGIGMTIEDDVEASAPAPSAATPRPRLSTSRATRSSPGDRTSGPRPRAIVQGRTSARPNGEAPTSAPRPLVPAPTGSSSGRDVDLTERPDEAPLFSGASGSSKTQRMPKANHSPVWRPDGSSASGASKARTDGEPVSDGR